MAYLTNADLTARVGTARAAELTTESGGTPSTAVLSSVVAAAIAEVDRYLSKRVAVPVDCSSDADRAAALKALSLDVAEYRLNLRRPPVSDALKKLYDDVIAWLKSYAEGKANLPGESTPTSQTSDQPVADYGFVRPDAGAEDMV